MADNEGSSGEKGGWSDMMREAALSGVAAVFMGEDAIRRYVKDLKIPKELVSQLVDGMAKKKDDFYGLLAKEFGQMLSKVDLGKEIAGFLRQNNIQLQAKISFEPKPESTGESK